jgi:hypothetical protein
MLIFSVLGNVCMKFDQKSGFGGERGKGKGGDIKIPSLVGEGILRDRRSEGALLKVT